MKLTDVFSSLLDDQHDLRLVATATLDEIPAVVDNIKDLLRARHRLPNSEEDDLTIRTMEDIAKMIPSTSHTMMFMLMSIALISLILGGIDIMTILLVSVTEREKPDCA